MEQVMEIDVFNYKDEPLEDEHSALLTYESFAAIIEKICEEHELNHIEAICHYCEEHDIDVTEIAPLINRSMKEKIKIVAQENGMMKKESMLPI